MIKDVASSRSASVEQEDESVSVCHVKRAGVTGNIKQNLSCSDRLSQNCGKKTNR
jgi:hypothetical protein